MMPAQELFRYKGGFDMDIIITIPEYEQVFYLIFDFFIPFISGALFGFVIGYFYSLDI